MKLVDLQEAVREITFDQDQQKQMVMAVQTGKKHGRPERTLRIAAAFAACFIAVAVLSVPVRAVVSSLVRERMEELPEAEVTEIAEEIQNQAVGADSATREYTEEEKERRAKLYQEYLKGTFPEKELPRVDSEAEAEKYEFCFLSTTSVFYLPDDRALTDEEILEQIDFEKKRDYALERQQAEETAKNRAAEQEKIEGDPITEEQAAAIAERYLKQLFDLSGEGMEINSYYEYGSELLTVYKNTYCVNWSNMGEHKYYYFYIDAQDGSLRSVSFSRAVEENGMEGPSPGEAAEKLPLIREKAEDFQKKLENGETYQKISCHYLLSSENEVGRFVGVLFEKADGTACLVECTWEGEVWNYTVTSKEEYEEGLRNTASGSAERKSREQGREVTVEIITVEE